MPANTTYGVPYPESTDPVSEGATNMQAIAEALDTKVLAGRLDWGPAGAPDTSLYRYSAGVVATPGQIYAGSHMFVDLLDAGSRLYFGSLADTSLRRTGVGILDTPNALTVGGNLSALELVNPYRLSYHTSLNSIADCNVTTRNGWYGFPAGALNGPVAGDGFLRVFAHNDSYCRQYWYHLYSTDTYQRFMAGAGWTAWEKIWPPTPVTPQTTSLLTCIAKGNAVQSLPPQTWTPISFPVVQYNNGMTHDGNTAITVPVTGAYFVNFVSAGYDGGGGYVSYYNVRLLRNSVVIAETPNAAQHQYGMVVPANAGDYFQVAAWNDAGSTSYNTFIRNELPNFSVTKQ